MGTGAEADQVRQPNKGMSCVLSHCRKLSFTKPNRKPWKTEHRNFVRDPWVMPPDKLTDDQEVVSFPFSHSRGNVLEFPMTRRGFSNKVCKVTFAESTGLSKIVVPQ